MDDELDSSEMMAITVVRCGDEALVRAEGALDLATAGGLARALAEAAATSRFVVLDLRDLAFIDAAGLGVIAAGKSRLGDRLVIQSPSAQVQRVLSISRLDHLVAGGPALR